MIDIMMIIVNRILNIKCSFHVNFCMTPPHEHGMYSLYCVIIMIYEVNTDIRKSAVYKPTILVFGIANRTTVSNSPVGMNMDITEAYGDNIGD